MLATDKLYFQNINPVMTNYGDDEDTSRLSDSIFESNS